MSNAEKALPERSLTIGGKKRGVKFSFRALNALEKETGKSALDGSLLREMRVSNLTLYVFHTTRAVDPSITMDEIEDGLDLSDLGDVIQVINLAYEDAMAVFKKKNPELFAQLSGETAEPAQAPAEQGT